MQAGLDHIRSVASYSWYLTCTKDPLAIDRLGTLVNTVQSGSDVVFMASCRSCSGNYLLSNANEKKERARTFHCEACRKKNGNQQLKFFKNQRFKARRSRAFF